MNDPELLKDLIKDFQSQKQALKTQMELVDPMAAAMHKPAAHRFIQAGFLLFLELFMWVLVVACFAVLVFGDKLYPFYYLSQIVHDNGLYSRYPQQDLSTLSWTIKGIIVFSGLLCFWIGRMLAKIRHKNHYISLSGKNLKLLMEQYFRRRTEIENLENKYPPALPSDPDSVIPPPKPHDDILL